MTIPNAVEARARPRKRRYRAEDERRAPASTGEETANEACEQPGTPFDLDSRLYASRAAIIATVPRELRLRSMGQGLRAVLLVLIAVASCLHPAQRAHAQPVESQDASEYDAVVAQALAFHAQGDADAARELMERAHRLSPSARTLRGLGIIAVTQGRNLSAMRYLDQALASEVKALPADLRASVEQLREQIWERVGRYQVRITPSVATLWLDGEAPDPYEPATWMLEPGSHVLMARAEGHETYELKLEVTAGARETLHIVLAKKAPPVIIERASTPLYRVDHGALPRFTPTRRYASLGVGTGLVLGGATLWATARVRYGKLADACERNEPKGCTQSEARRRYDEKNIGPLFVSGLIVAGTGVAVLASVAAIETYLFRRGKSKVRALLGPSSLVLHGAF